MRLEVSSQWLDAAAFVMVTPEFLGEERIRGLRLRLHSFLLATNPDKLTIREKALGLFVAVLLTPVFGALSIWVDTSSDKAVGVYWYLMQALFGTQASAERKYGGRA